MPPFRRTAAPRDILFSRACASFVAILFLCPSISCRRSGAGPAAAGGECPLELSVSVVYAVQDGPLVVKVALINRGSEMYHCCVDGVCGLQLKRPGPKGWKWKGHGPCNGWDSGKLERIAVAPGETFRHGWFIPLHHDYETGAGRFEVEFTFGVLESPADRPCMEKDTPRHQLSRAVTLDIQQRSPETSRQLAADLLARTRRAKAIEELEMVVACIQHTWIRELVPVALEVLRREPEFDDLPGSYHKWRTALNLYLLPWIYDVLPGDEAIDVICATVSSPNTGLAEPAVATWHGNFGAGSPTDQQFARLRAVPNLWVQLSLLMYYPDRFTKEQADALLQQAATYKTPLEKKDIEKFVRDLDDDSFARRDKASTQLIALGERALPALTDIARTARTAEAETRLANVIAAIRRRPPDRDEVQFVGAAERRAEDTVHGSPYARPILEALGKNPAEDSLTIRAKAALAELEVDIARRKK